MYKRSILSVALAAAALGVNAQKSMTAPAGGKAISDELIGIFFEDINNSADGGLYAELVQNGSFEFSPVERDGWGAGTAWKMIRPGHSTGWIETRMDNPVHQNNATYMRLHAERTKEYYDYRGWRGFGLQNEGWDGISVKAGEKYDFSVFLRNIGDAKQLEAIAQELWNDTNSRECRLAAPMLYPAESMTLELASTWCDTVETVEIADNLCHKLLRHMKDAPSLMRLLIRQESALVKYTGYRLLLNLLLFGKVKPNATLRDIVEDEAIRALPPLKTLLRDIVEELGVPD